MFGLAWTEIALIGVVAMVLIGPKDLPIAVKALAEMVKKARRMAGEFQVHVDEMMRDSNLREVRDSIAEIRRMDITGDIRRAVDADGSLHAALNENPFQQPMASSTSGLDPFPVSKPDITTGAMAGAMAGAMPDAAATAVSTTGVAGTIEMHPAAPSFIPPAEAEAAPPPPPAVPAFIPPTSMSRGEAYAQRQMNRRPTTAPNP